MNKKILLIVTLVLLTVISIGAISAAETDDVAVDDTVGDIDVDDVAVEEVLSEESAPEEPIAENDPIEIDNTMTNDEIQAKLNTITNNSVVNFAPGEYNDVNLVVDTGDDTRLSNVVFNGNGATLIGTPIWGSAADDTTGYWNGIFEIRKIDGFTLSGFNFKALGVDKANIYSPSCVIIHNTTNGIIENNNITGGRFGLYVGSKFNAPNKNTIIRNNFVTGVTDMGIISFGSPGSKILNNTVLNAKNHGIDVRHQTGNNSLVQGNTIIGAKEGIYLMHSGGHTVLENNITNCGIGITCYGSKNIFIDYNNFTQTKIRILLSSGYGNITVGENNNYGALNPAQGQDIPMPPTFAYYIVRGDSEYVLATSGTFSDGDGTVKQGTTRIQAYYLTEEGDQIEFSDLSIIKLDTTEQGLAHVTLKVWIDDDNNHIPAGETIQYAIDGVVTNATSDDTGAVYADLSGLAPGKHYLTVSYAGTTELIKSTFSCLLEVEGTPATREITTIDYKNMTTTAVDTKSDGRIGEYFIITLKDSTGKAIANKPVQIGFNGVVYDRVTDDNGQAKLQINLKAAGVYTFAVAYLGDDQYNGSFIVAKITVNKQKASLTVPAKSYKASAATKTLTATFKSAKGNPVAGKKVTFTVNGKTYSATTDAKGVATVKVSLNKKGTYSFTAKFAGDNTYAAISKTAKLTIK